MELRLILCILNWILGFISIILHLIGIYLLRKPNQLHKNQIIYLQHLSICEIISQIFICVILVLPNNHSMHNAYAAVVIFNSYFNTLTWLCIAILLTVDRFLEIWLNIKYELHVSNRRTTKALIAVWITNGLSAILAVFFSYVTNADLMKIIHRIILPVFMIIIIGIFVSTYIYIYLKLRKQTSLDGNNSVNRLRKKKRRGKHI